MVMYRKELLNSVVEQKFDEELFLSIARELIKELELTEYVKDVDPYIKQILLNYNDLSNYERMVLGLPIDIDLFIKLYNQIVDNNLPTDIKEYVLNI